MQRRSHILLDDALFAAELILRNTADRTLEDYLEDPWFRSAVERNYEVIGEAVRMIERRDPELVAAIPKYRDVIDFRNRIAHGYYNLNHVRVWRYTREELPGLRDAIAALRDSLGGTAEPESTQ